VQRENINGSLLEFIPHQDAGQGQALKGEKNENDKNADNFGFGIGGRFACGRRERRLHPRYSH
jgi:hypothetical protein